MKISIPFFVWDAICQVNTVLGILAQNCNYKDWKVCLPRHFVPRKIETKSNIVRMWANGTYITCRIRTHESAYGQHTTLLGLEIKTKEYRGIQPQFVEFTLDEERLEAVTAWPKWVRELENLGSTPERNLELLAQEGNEEAVKHLLEMKARHLAEMNRLKTVLCQ